ncbi:MAG: class C beta-lactamase-related serine hydrolase [Cytophagales bacterium]|nr:MAG: class C beta-lactamase-related serine hydrolase [Cytophagales bacterium]TAF61496.1 MAG: class C beta-lactamase-related serine hydrolase [Cytophagales bacterium]
MKLAFFNLTCCFLLMFGLASCQVGRFIFYNFANISDHKKFPARKLSHNHEAAFKFHLPGNAGKKPKSITLNGKELPFDKFLKQSNTVAFLIIKNDTIQYESYQNGYEQESIVASFSMAKSVLSILVGCAIDEGLIQSVEEPITNYVPELATRGFERVRIKHLLQMTSGLKFNESYYNPFGDAARYYYGRHLRKYMKQMKLAKTPGTEFSYTSGNTQLLGLVLERALKNKRVTEYLQEKIWTPLGMEYGGSWSIDKKKNGMEKTFCCLNARARDFAKLGRLYLHKGQWHGNQIVSQKWVEESTTPDLSEGGVNYYKYQWWLPSDDGDFMAQGILGQYVYANPKKDLIIVRLGKNHGKANWTNIIQGLANFY